MRILGVLCGVAAAFTLSVTLASPAVAAGSSKIPTAPVSVRGGECGSSYALVGVHPVNNQHTDETELHMEIYWSSSAKRNCLISHHQGDAYGQARDTLAMIRPTGSAWPACPSSVGCDRGNYAYYAGPVYTPAGVDMSNRCIDFGGTAGIQVDKILYKQHCD